MAAEDTNAEDLFPTDVIPEPVPEAEPQLVPAPWHKPRKQWIRKEQWGRLVEGLMDELDLHDMPFRYLTLPGRHLFDVRHLHDICAKRGRRLQYLGFDISRKNDPQLSVSEHEVRSLPFIHGDSVLLADRLESLAASKPGSMAMSYARKLKSFDVINLDLCDSVASRRSHPDSSSLAAIAHLVQLQADGRTDPWLMFLTTRASRETVNSGVMKKLLDVVQKNLAEHDQFRRSVANTSLFDAQAVAEECDGRESLVAPAFVRAFGVGFCKWLLQLSRSTWAVKHEIAACYRVYSDANSPDMLSLAFRFERYPTAVIDPNGVVSAPRGRTQVSIPTELDLEIGFVECFNGLVDVDQLLHDDSNLREQMIQENADLMSLARFSRQRIVDWGREVCWRPPTSISFDAGPIAGSSPVVGGS